MNVIIDINGRKAIPVRGIPFLTDWTVLAPLELAERLSSQGCDGEIRGLTSYRVDGVDVQAIKPSWWIDASVAVDSIHDVSKANNASHREWQLTAIQTLPEAAFVWLDEFEVCFSQSFLDQDSDSASEELANLKPAMLGLNFTPFIERDMLALVMQGFQHLVRPEQTAAAAPVVTELVTAIESAPYPAIKKEGYLLKRSALVKKYVATWPDIDSDLNHASENGLSEAAKGTKHGDWFESAVLAWGDQRGKRQEQPINAASNSIFNVPGTKYSKP